MILLERISRLFIIDALGVVMAANTALYSDDVSQYYHHNGASGSPPTTSDGCGVCYEVTGPGGSAVAIIADICDDESACTQFINGASFNLYDREASDSQVWDDVMGESFGAGTVTAPTGVTYQKVACPLSLLGSEHVSLKWELYNCCANSNSGVGRNGAMLWTVLNHRVQIVKMEVRNSPNGEFVELERSWTNKFDAPYDAANGNKKWWVFDQEYTIRITSVTNTIEYTLDPTKMIDEVTNTVVTELGVNDQLGRPYRGEIQIEPLVQFDDFGNGNRSPQLSVLITSFVLLALLW
eukprot:TRINITY_DN3024_c0_g1_i2.p1 TRINITY_DN3024_c0_g1~~TRINITY_DN3024_c0_g1_i2.p1  ORF type:complete len:295 (+),score=64.46 TRINITY_DN3024_c0_g1_i2:212-1096(+)